MPVEELHAFIDLMNISLEFLMLAVVVLLTAGVQVWECLTSELPFEQVLI